MSPQYKTVGGYINTDPYFDVPNSDEEFEDNGPPAWDDEDDVPVNIYGEETEHE